MCAVWPTLANRSRSLISGRWQEYLHRIPNKGCFCWWTWYVPTTNLCPSKRRMAYSAVGPEHDRTLTHGSMGTSYFYWFLFFICIFLCLVWPLSFTIQDMLGCFRAQILGDASKRRYTRRYPTVDKTCDVLISCICVQMSGVILMGMMRYVSLDFAAVFSDLVQRVPKIIFCSVELRLIWLSAL